MLSIPALKKPPINKFWLFVPATWFYDSVHNVPDHRVQKAFTKLCKSHGLLHPVHLVVRSFILLILFIVCFFVNTKISLYAFLNSENF